MTPDAEARARELFFAFDGSEFYMSRDGVEEEFTALAVPPEKRREWMRELTANRLASLDQPGNWRTISFLSHHSDYSHVAEVLAARPQGVWPQQVAFLEELLHLRSGCSVAAPSIGERSSPRCRNHARVRASAARDRADI